MYIGYLGIKAEFCVCKIYIHKTQLFQVRFCSLSFILSFELKNNLDNFKFCHVKWHRNPTKVSSTHKMYLSSTSHTLTAEGPFAEMLFYCPYICAQGLFWQPSSSSDHPLQYHVFQDQYWLRRPKLPATLFPALMKRRTPRVRNLFWLWARITNPGLEVGGH